MILNIEAINKIYLSNQFVDMRKSIDGLTAIVTLEYKLDVLDHSLFIFTNKARNRIKILYYESNGFWLLTKRLEQGKFKIKEDKNTKTKKIEENELSWLLEGLEFKKNKYEKYSSKRLLV